MEVKNFQNEIFNFALAWDNKQNITPSEQATLIHLVEEVGELAREYVNKESRKDKFSDDELNNAIGDALIQLIKLAQLRNVDIENLILKIIEDEQQLLKQ